MSYEGKGGAEAQSWAPQAQIWVSRTSGSGIVATGKYPGGLAYDPRKACFGSKVLFARGLVDLGLPSLAFAIGSGPPVVLLHGRLRTAAAHRLCTVSCQRASNATKDGPLGNAKRLNGLYYENGETSIVMKGSPPHEFH